MDLAVIGMGRLGGGEMGFGSDADVLFVHRARAGADEAARRRRPPTRSRTPCAGCSASPRPTRPSRWTPTCGPEGRQGALVRSLSAFREYYERWVSVWEVQALLRAVPVAGDEELGDGLRRADRPDPLSGRGADRASRSPRSAGSRRGWSGSGCRAAPTRPRTPSSAAAASPTSSGPSSCCSCSTPRSDPELQVPSTVEALDRAAGRRAAGRRRRSSALRAAWELATRARNAIFLVRGRPSDQLPRPGLELAGVARACGYGPDSDAGPVPRRLPADDAARPLGRRAPLLRQPAG